MSSFIYLSTAQIWRWPDEKQGQKFEVLSATHFFGSWMDLNFVSSFTNGEVGDSGTVVYFVGASFVVHSCCSLTTISAIIIMFLCHQSMLALDFRLAKTGDLRIGGKHIKKLASARRELLLN
ncbi:hypothetical protein ACMD2_18164 [Ananas comosus]|uniref:Uncharacterized protein n=1 Tax=Ananas comosus TaxID=4615 RepID=A0A199VJC6_ANACO|nr:hypothetical protein ACMD2_18164 [Ananas comosus]